MKRIIDDGFLTLLEARDLYIDRPMNGLFGGERRSRAYGSSLEFADYREYAEGDDLRRVDWNLWARFEKLFLKLYVDERQLYHRIYIDASASMKWGEPTKGETALKLAAALAYMAVRANDRVQLSVIRGRELSALGPAFTGTGGFYTAANKLNDVKFKGDAEWSQAFLETNDTGRDDGFTIILSDFLVGGDFRSAINRLLFRGRRVFLLQILAPEELDPDMRGRVMLFDSESGGEEDARNFRTTVTRARIKAYRQALAAHQKELLDYCAARGVGFFSVSSDERVEKILFDKATEERLIK